MTWQARLWIKTKVNENDLISAMIGIGLVCQFGSAILVVMNDSNSPSKKICFHSSAEEVEIFQSYQVMSSGGGSVGRAVASNSRCLRFKSSHRQKIILNIYSQLYWKDKNEEKEAGNGPLF